MGPKHPGGRPTKYDPAFCDRVEKEMAKGFSLTAFAGLIGVSRATINNWMAENPEFLEAVSRAKALRLVHWEKAAMKVAMSGGGPGTATVIVFGLKNMGSDDWSDTSKVEAKVESKVEVSPDAAFADFVGRLESVARSATANTPTPSGMDGDGATSATGSSGK
jgi:transposase